MWVPCGIFFTVQTLSKNKKCHGPQQQKKEALFKKLFDVAKGNAMSMLQSEDRLFLEDQRTARIGKIGSVDPAVVAHAARLAVVHQKAASADARKCLQNL
jgi:hypothetical protein